MASAADVLWRAMTDPDGQKLGAMAELLLVPTALRIPALRLMNSQTIYDAGEEGDSNPGAGPSSMSSTYLTEAKVWYMLCDPNEDP